MRGEGTVGGGGVVELLADWGNVVLMLTEF